MCGIMAVGGGRGLQKGTTFLTVCLFSLYNEGPLKQELSVKEKKIAPIESDRQTHLGKIFLN